MGCYLDDSTLARDLEHLSLADRPVTEAHINYFCKLGELDIVENDKRTIDLDHCSVVDARSDVVVAGDCLYVGAVGVKLLH